MLEKMGWNEGEKLGSSNKEHGLLEPVSDCANQKRNNVTVADCAKNAWSTRWFGKRQGGDGRARPTFRQSQNAQIIANTVAVPASAGEQMWEKYLLTTIFVVARRHGRPRVSSADAISNCRCH
jgi:hypothetical protein